MTIRLTNMQPSYPYTGHTAHVKGAPNYIMDECTSYLTADGTVLPLDAETKKVSFQHSHSHVQLFFI